MNAEDQDVVTPGLEPGADAKPLDDPAFIEKCRPTVDELVTQAGAKLGKSLLTREETWGPVWRADFTFPEKDLSPLVNRIVCWTAPNGSVSVEMAIGQRVKPL